MPKVIADDQRADHFWSKVRFDGTVPEHAPELGQCWLWGAYRKENGYGQHWVRRKPVYAHVYAYMITYGQPPAQVLHHCDVRACVRPNHLYSGTQAQNLADARERGRLRPRTKVPFDVVLALREQYPEGLPHGVSRKLAATLGISRSHLSDIIHGRKRAVRLAEGRGR